MRGSSSMFASGVPGTPLASSASASRLNPRSAGSLASTARDSSRRSRSKSPPRTALPGLRRDAPARREVSSMASLPLWASDQDRADALQELRQDVHAASTKAGVVARLGTIGKAITSWNLEPWPPIVNTLLALSASLKRGGYRSSANFLYTYKAEAQRRGHHWPQQFDRLLRDCLISCERGLGAPRGRRPCHLTGWESYLACGRHGSRRAQLAPGISSWWVPIGCCANLKRALCAPPW